MFAGPTTTEDLSSVYLAARARLAEQAEGFGGIDLMRAHSDLTDALVSRVHALAARESGLEQPPADLAIAAVGGYGRREMAPFSDVDVAFIVGAEEDDEVDAVVKRAFRLLMDVLEQSGISVGYSYRRADEVGNLPLETQTALLDARRVAGSASLFAAFKVALRKSIVPAAFVISHSEQRLGSGPGTRTPFVVEPDVKDGDGGLRDLHTARWIAQVTFGLDGDDVWDGLRSRGVLSDRDIEEADSAAEFLARARNALHLLVGRCLDVLGTDRQSEVAARLGFGDTREFVSRYFSHAHRLKRICEKTATACAQADLMIEPGVVARDGRLYIMDRGLLDRDQAAAIRVFRHAQEHHLKISSDAAGLIYDAARASIPTAEAGQTFVDILSRSGAGAALRSMADLGVLQAMVPQFSDLMYLLPGDAAHRFTVGEHSLRAVQELERLLAEGDERFADVFSRVQHFEVLFLAVLLHDIGKLDSRKDHSKTGAFRASKIATGLGLPEDARAKVEFLIRHHLRMAETARLRDLHQPKTVRDFVAVVRDPQLLDMLFLLTVADLSAVGTANWSRVQMRFLLELHERASAAIRSPDAAGPDIDRHRTRVRRELCLANLPPDEVDEHCNSMPAAYLLNTPPEELAAHIGYVRVARDRSPVVEIKDSRGGEFTVLTIVTMDQPGLLSRIAGVMHGLGVDIHAAQIFTRASSDQIAIDTLYIDFEGRQLSEMKKWQVEGELTSVLTGSATVDDLIRRFGKGLCDSPGPMTVTALDNLSDHATVIEVRAHDRPGLLYYLTGRISELSLGIHSARVATWGHEARDVFYVTDRAGSRLTPDQIALFRDALSRNESASL